MESFELLVGWIKDHSTWLAGLVVAVYAAALTSYLSYFFRIRQERLRDELEARTNVLTKLLTEEGYKAPTAVDEPRERVRQELLETAFNRMYLYLDEARVNDEYSKLGGTMSVASVQLELADALKTDQVLGVSEFLHSEAGEETIKKVLQKYEPREKTITHKYEEWERYALAKDLVQFGLESIEITTASADAFAKELTRLKERFGFSPNSAEVQQHRAKLLDEATSGVMKSLGKEASDVLLRGKFKFSTVDADKKLQFEFDHPANDKLGLKKKIVFFFVLEESKLNTNARDMLSGISSIDLRVFGKTIPKFTGAEYRWQILPVAVYR